MVHNFNFVTYFTAPIVVLTHYFICLRYEIMVLSLTLKATDDNVLWIYITQMNFLPK